MSKYTVTLTATSVKNSDGTLILLRSHDLAATGDTWFTTAPELPGNFDA